MGSYRSPLSLALSANYLFIKQSDLFLETFLFLLPKQAQPHSNKAMPVSLFLVELIVKS